MLISWNYLLISPYENNSLQVLPMLVRYKINYFIYPLRVQAWHTGLDSSLCLGHCLPLCFVSAHQSSDRPPWFVYMLLLCIQFYLPRFKAVFAGRLVRVAATVLFHGIGLLSLSPKTGRTKRSI